jgi:hypothetical protein
MLAPLSLMGWVSLALFTAVGLVAVPFEFIAAFVHRPPPIDQKTWDRLRIKFGERAAPLIMRGRSFQDKPPKRTQWNRYNIVRILHEICSLLLKFVVHS